MNYIEDMIEMAKSHLIKYSDIESRPDEMKVIDSILIKCANLGFLDKFVESTQADILRKHLIMCEEYQKNDDLITHKGRYMVAKYKGKVIAVYDKKERLCSFSNPFKTSKKVLNRLNAYSLGKFDIQRFKSAKYDNGEYTVKYEPRIVFKSNGEELLDNKLGTIGNVKKNLIK